RANKRAILLCNGPSKGGTRPMSRRPTRALAKTAEPGRPTSQGVKDHRATSHRHGDPGNSEPADTIARPPTGPQARRSPGIQQLRARDGQGAQTRPAHVSVDATAAGMRAALRAGRQDCSDLHRAWQQGCILAMAKVPSGSAANAMY